MIALAGFSYGLNVFARLPNLVGFAMIAGVVFHGWLEGDGPGNTAKRALAFALGCLALLMVLFFAPRVFEAAQAKTQRLLALLIDLTLVRLAKGNTRETDWPRNHMPCRSEVCRVNRAVVERFLTRFDYRPV